MNFRNCANLFLLLLAITVPSISHAQITVILQQPPPYQFKVEHIWKLTLVNPTQTTYRISLHGRATELYEGLIVDATTTTFALPPGTKIINPRELVPINIRDANPKYRVVVQNIGGVPTGDYEICVSVINAANGQELGFDCVQTQVENLTRVELLEPEAGARFSMYGTLNDEVWNQPLRRTAVPPTSDQPLWVMIYKGPDGSSTAYMMGDPVPGIDVSLEQVPGGKRIPVKGWDEYISEVGVKEEGVKFAAVRVVTDTGGSTIAYLMGDPVPGVDISLEQIPGGKRIPLKGPDEYLREVGIKEEGVKRIHGALDDWVQAAQNHSSERKNIKPTMKNAGVSDETIEEILSRLITAEDWNEQKADIRKTLTRVGIKEEGV
ncbi:MAG: hypothetical protein AAB393_09360, partial [Bacteroidota bacterium]